LETVYALSFGAVSDGSIHDMKNIHYEKAIKECMMGFFLRSE
jgi:hypothetical protein